MSGWRADTIFCDDIRQENNGKYILIGVFGEDVVPPEMPARFPIGIWARIYGFGKGQHKFEFSLVGPGARGKAQIGGILEIRDESEPAILAMAGLPIEVREVGHIKAMMRVDDGDEFEIGRIKVSLPPDATPPSEAEKS